MRERIACIAERLRGRLAERRTLLAATYAALASLGVFAITITAHPFFTKTCVGPETVPAETRVTELEASLLESRKEAEAYKVQLRTAKHRNAELEAAVHNVRLEQKVSDRGAGRASGRENTLAFANANPMNIKAPSDHYWEGQVGRDKAGHAIFKDWRYGVRAGANVLLNYEKRHGIRTIRGIVERFCTSAKKRRYMNHLSEKLGIGIDEEFSIRNRLPELLIHMAWYESNAVLQKRHVAWASLMRNI